MLTRVEIHTPSPTPPPRGACIFTIVGWGEGATADVRTSWNRPEARALRAAVANRTPFRHPELGDGEWQVARVVELEACNGNRIQRFDLLRWSKPMLPS